MIEKVDGVMLASMVTAGFHLLEGQKQAVNELNVFPVPDGDTGINMSMTLGAGSAALAQNPTPHAGKTLEMLASALLRGARGNSGVILSLLFRGFGAALKERTELNGHDFAEGLSAGVSAAYSAVMKPAEGTILTVSRVAASRCLQAAILDPALETVLTEALTAAEEALLETVNQNPVLKQAGVIDAGGKGLCIIFEGMLACLQGRACEPPATIPTERQDGAHFADYSAADITFTYCTEFIVLRDDPNRDTVRLRAFLEAVGDSIVVVDDETLIKVHVHTDNPGKVLEEALTFGALTAVKVENMREQHTEQVVQQTGAAVSTLSAPTPEKPDRPFGFVAVCAGAGLWAVLRDLCVDRQVEGGQTMNPSTEDILRAIESTPAEVVFVFPNNKNVIMSAEQCVPLATRRVIVLPTRSIPQCIAAMLAFDANGSVAENHAAMLAALERVRTGEITYAVRDSVVDDHPIHQGDHMALLGKRLLAANPDRRLVLMRMAQEMKDADFITLFYGEGVSASEAEETASLFRETCPAAEVTVVAGGQPVYAYLIAAE